MCSCKILIAIIPFMFVTAQCVVAPTCPPDFYSHAVGASEKCCKFCPSGTYLMKHCSKDNFSECLECPNDYYTDRANTYKQCISCTDCTGMTYLKTPCTKTADTVCHCISGYFFKSFSSTCERCKDCKIGHGVVVDCTHLTRRKCRPCIEGVSFSTRKNVRCSPCRQCGVNEIKTSNCTISQDTKCRAVPPARPPRNSSDYMLVAIITVVVSLIIILAVILFVRKRITINCCFAGGGHPTPVSSVDRRAPRPSTSARVPEEAVQLRVDCSSSSIPKENMVFKDLPYDIVEELSKLLNPRTLRHKNWKTLAGLLSYNQIDIAEFEREDSPADRLFMEYLTLSDSSVQRLYTLFVKMKRQDCARILVPFVRTDLTDV